MNLEFRPAENHRIPLSPSQLEEQSFRRLMESSFGLEGQPVARGFGYGTELEIEASTEMRRLEEATETELTEAQLGALCRLAFNSGLEYRETEGLRTLATRKPELFRTIKAIYKAAPHNHLKELVRYFELPAASISARAAKLFWRALWAKWPNKFSRAVSELQTMKAPSAREVMSILAFACTNHRFPAARIWGYQYIRHNASPRVSALFRSVMLEDHDPSVRSAVGAGTASESPDPQPAGK